MLTLNNDCLASVTAVPDLFLEQYMPAANGEFVKVYLYLLKMGKDHQQDSTLSSMADFFSCTENDIIRALKYWEKQGLLSLSYTTGENGPTGISFLPLVRKEESGILPTPESSISGPVVPSPAASAVPEPAPQAEPVLAGTASVFCFRHRFSGRGAFQSRRKKGKCRIQARTWKPGRTAARSVCRTDVFRPSSVADRNRMYHVFL